MKKLRLNELHPVELHPYYSRYQPRTSRIVTAWSWGAIALVVAVILASGLDLELLL